MSFHKKKTEKIELVARPGNFTGTRCTFLIQSFLSNDIKYVLDSPFDTTEKKSKKLRCNYIQDCGNITAEEMNVEKKIFKIDPNFRVVALAEPPSSTSGGGIGSGGGSSQQQQVGSLAIQYNASSKCILCSAPS